MPPHKLHKNCDCYLTKVKSADVKTSAFPNVIWENSPNIFLPTVKKSKGKLANFESLGYNKNDSNILKEEYEKQALDEYLSGNYTLKDLDKNGQRLAIAISLKGKRFFTGWMI